MTESAQPTRMGDLASFIEETLIQIVEGVAGAQNEASDFGARINPGLPETPFELDSTARMTTNSTRRTYIQIVEFDVAITRATELATNVKGGIQVVGIGVGGATANADAMTNVSRIKFSVPVAFPTHED